MRYFFTKMEEKVNVGINSSTIGLSNGLITRFLQKNIFICAVWVEKDGFVTML